MPEFKEIETHNLTNIPEQAMYANANIHLSKGQQDSPDSGHREMSSDSLSYNLSGSDNNGNGSSNSWYPLGINQGAYNINGPPHMKPLNNSGINVHGQEFNLQMRTSHHVNKVSPNNNSFNVNPFSPKKEVKSPKSNNKKETQIITPLPSQDASGNKLELNVAPKIEPPPKVKRTSSRASQGQGDLLISPDSQTMSSRSSTTSETSFSDKRISRDSSKMGDDLNANLTSLMSPLNKSNNSSTATSPNHNTGVQQDISVNFNNSSHQKFHAPPKQQNLNTANENEYNMNNLSNSPNSRHSQNSSHKGSFISHADSTTKLRLSFSDEENTENSEDSGVPQQANNGLDSMTFEEFDALGS